MSTLILLIANILSLLFWVLESIYLLMKCIILFLLRSRLPYSTTGAHFRQKNAQTRYQYTKKA